MLAARLDKWNQPHRSGQTNGTSSYVRSGVCTLKPLVVRAHPRRKKFYSTWYPSIYCIKGEQKLLDHRRNPYFHIKKRYAQICRANRYSISIPLCTMFRRLLEKCPPSIDSLIVVLENPKRARNFNKKPRLKRSWKEYTRTKEILLRNGSSFA